MIPITPRTSAHFGQWCQMYQEGGTVPQPGHIRYAIGVYQISQGMSWPISNPVRWQSFCSAAMHFTMSGHAFGINIADTLPNTLEEITDTFEGWDKLMLSVGKAQQQIVYGYFSKGSTRQSRFSAEALAMQLHVLVTRCFALVPADRREQGCFDEMKILMGDLPSKP